MTTKAEIKVALPEAVENGLEKFSQQIADALKDDLICSALYGGIVKREYHRTSDVNVILIFKSISVEVLDKIAPYVREAWQNIRLVPMVLSEEELKASANVFAIKFIDIQKNHVILSGRDVFADLNISRDHLRFLCEQSLKNELLRLQQFYLNGNHRPELIETRLIQTISAIVMDLRVMLRLKTGQSPKENNKEAITQAWIAQFGGEGKIFLDVLQIKMGKMKPGDVELKNIYNQFLNAVQYAAKLVEKL